MEFLEEIKHSFGQNFQIDNAPYKAYILGNKGIVIWGIKDVYSFSSTSIMAKLKITKIELQGANLAITSFSNGELVVSGQISKVEIIK